MSHVNRKIFSSIPVERRTISETKNPFFYSRFLGGRRLLALQYRGTAWANEIVGLGARGARCGRGASGLHSHAERRNEGIEVRGDKLLPPFRTDAKTPISSE